MISGARSGSVSTVRTTPGRRTSQRRRFITGFIPEATGPMPADMRHALDELRQHIEERAEALAEEAVTTRPAWMKSLGTVPRESTNARERWEKTLRAVVAYRDRYGIDTPTSLLGPASDNTQHRIDRERIETLLAEPAEPASSHAPSAMTREGVQR
ncbi:hypothetical protein GCM10009823_05250 [Brevibacterium salitolerans]|uniref:Uncharacterized protein n=1 Tax=Brevibacterium salitolerans TaxID=1403566 RepID=A0ABN2WDU8_9MICO